MADPVLLARRIVDEAIRPSVRGWENTGRFPRDVVAGSGLTAMFVPQDLGGVDLPFATIAAVFEELGRGDAALAFAISMHNAVANAVARAGDDEIRARWLRPLVSGEALGGFCLTEPQAGSDATAITTRARRHGGAWRLTGTKAWVTLGGEAEVFLVVAKTEDAPRHADIAMFVMSADDAGVSFGPPYDKAAANYLPICDMQMEGAAALMLAPPGQGIPAALAAIDVARFDISAIANGLLAESLDVATRYAAEREVFGKPVLAHQGMGWALADVATDLEAARGLTRRAAELHGAPEWSVAVAHAKRFCPDAALRGSIVCSETLGAYGWLHDYPFARSMALAKMLQVVDGTSEVQRLVIARDLLRRASP
jgi:alkylation response protein AidB-like acyl-CoA dehydrogenase